MSSKEIFAYVGGCLFALWVVCGIVAAIFHSCDPFIVAGGVTTVFAILGFGTLCSHWASDE